MANDVNVVVLVGRLTKDCEIRSTASGVSVCRFSIAVNRRKKVQDAWTDEVSYFDAVLWGKQAETLRPYLVKGKQVSISGELRQDRWEQDGQTRSRVEIFVNNLQLLSVSSSPNTGFNQEGVANQSFQNNAKDASNGGFASRGGFGSEMGPEAFEDSDIPF